MIRRLSLVIFLIALAGCSGKVEITAGAGGHGAAPASGGEGGSPDAGGSGGDGGRSGGTGGAGGRPGGAGGSGGTGGAGGNGGNGGTGGAQDAGPDSAVDSGPPPMGMLPLTDLVGGTYMSFEGGLYPGSNTPPPAHHAAGIERARAIQPLNAAGMPAANGKIVLLSIGMSNATQAFCLQLPSGLCPDQSFVAQALADEEVNDTTLVMIDGARGGQTTMAWVEPSSPEYTRVRDEQLAEAGVTEAQVQAIWLKNARPGPTVSLPANDADAYLLEADFGDIVRVLELRYPNLQQVFMTSRSYAGYATTPLNPEPYAYEGGFAVKWLIEAQIDQVAGAAIDARGGDLDYRNDHAPWLAWGAYIWANGTMPRAIDGLTYAMSDFGDDGTHPSIEGQRKIAGQLLHHFKTSPYTRCWFLAAAPECE